MLETTPANPTSQNHSPARRHLPVDGRTVADAYLRRIQISAADPLYLFKRAGQYHEMTWAQAHTHVLGVFEGLRRAGIQPGDKICIMSQTRPEWNLTDLAAFCYGCVVVPIYYSNSVEDVAFILENCEAKLIFVEDAPACEKLQESFGKTGKSLPLVTYDEVPGIAGLKMSSFSDFSSPPQGSAREQAEKSFRESAAKVNPDSPATIVYTSGTTGRPKGAVLLHAAFAAELRSVIEQIELRSSDLTVTFLPLAHIFGRIESLMPVFAGIRLGFAENVNSVAQNILEIKPTLLVSVPRIYEKIYTKIQSDVESKPQMTKNIFKWAIGVGKEFARLKSEKVPAPLLLSLKYRVADQLVFQKIRAKMGGRLRLTVSGGAPLSQDLCQLFHACGIKIMEGYGLTETCAAITVNRPDDYAFGTVGKPLNGCQIRIAEDGEIQVKGPVVFKEYYRAPEATAEVFTKDGWFCTGDIGEFTTRGFLKITDRKKELIVTSGGKKIAPQKLENLLKSSRFISNGLVFGDKQKYLVALVTLNEPEIKAWAKEHGVTEEGLDRISQSDQVTKLIEGEVHVFNEQLASYESIKKVRILPRDFSIENGELTPSLKVKRKVCVEKFRSEIDSMY